MSFVAVAIGGSALLGAAASNKASKTQAGTASQAAGLTTDQFQQNREALAPWARGGRMANDRLNALLGIGSGIGEDDPRFRAIYDPLVRAYEKRYTEKMGGNLYRDGDPRIRERRLEQLRRDAMAQATQQYGGSDPEYGSLLDDFTGEDLENEPGYQFGLSEGNKAIERAAAARGRYDSGDTLKALTRFGSDYASTKFDDAFNRDAANKSRTYGFLSGQSGTGVNAAGQMAGLGANAASGAGAALMQGADASAAGTVGAANALTNGVGSYLGYQNNQATLDYLKGLRKGTLTSGGTAAYSSPFLGQVR